MINNGAGILMLNDKEIIKKLKDTEYRYIGIMESKKVLHTMTKDNIQKKYLTKGNSMICNIIKTINIYAVSVA